MNPIRVASLLLLTMSLFLAGCGEGMQPASTPIATGQAGEASTPPAAKQDPDTLRVGTTYIWDSPNPAIGLYNYALRYLLYDTLLEEKGIDDWQPGLAQSWDVSEDGLVWTFQIRSGVRFHDGTLLTAQDVAWSLNWAIENQVKALSSYLGNFQEIVALDANSVQVTLSAPAGDMAERLMYVWILPRSVWEGLAGDDIVALNGATVATGTGPYKLVEWLEGEHLILEANEDYWQGPPAIARMVWQEYATQDAAIQALVEGEIDVVYQVPRTEIEALEEAEDVEVVVTQSAVVDHLILNSHAKGTQPKSLKDPAVRLAIAYAIDKQQIVDDAFLGYAEPATTLIPTSMGAWHNDQVRDVPFDPAEGNRVLDEAGYLDEDGDGLREDQQGKPLEYRLYAPEGETEMRILEIVAAALAQVGISTRPAQVDADVLLALYPEFDFDLIVWRWDLHAGPGFAMQILTCDQRKKGGWNDSGYCDPGFDELYAQQAVTVDQAARRDLIWQMQARLFEDRPYIVLVYEQQVQAYRSDRFEGFRPGAGDILWKSSLLAARPVR